MALWSLPRLLVVYATIAFVIPAVGGPALAGQQTNGAAPAPARILFSFDAVVGMVTCDGIDRAEEDLARWSRTRAYEKLAVAEALVGCLTSQEKCKDRSAPQWSPGGNDLSRVAGRGKWCLERILGVSLPDVRPDSSSEELRTLHAQGGQAVEAYRNGIIARAADDRVPPAEFARLKRKYRGRIVPRVLDENRDYMYAMEDLLAEWPPIGRKMEDLAAIIGSKAKTGDDHARGAAVYRFAGTHRETEYHFIMRDGIIRSVRRFSRH